jgi:diguanylate cyclase (GGDEF)-like protein
MLTSFSTTGIQRSVFRSLFYFMIAFGILIGLIFPPFARVVLASERALSPEFFAMCIAAGFLVGLINFILFDRVVSRDLTRVVRGMRSVLESVSNAESLGGECRNQCLLEITSRDAIGEIECSFNNMTTAIAHRLNKESTLRTMSSRLASSVELGEITQIILSSVANVCVAKAGLLYGKNGSDFTLLSSFGVDETDQLPKQLDQKLGPIHHALETNQTLTYSTESGELEWIAFSTPLGSFQPKLVLVIPLLVKQQPVGLLILACSCSELSSEDIDLIEFLRGQAAPYLSNAFLHREISDLAAMDDLTRILNRRFGLIRLKEEFSRSARHGLSISVIMLDVDHFKWINDTYGHANGDRILCSVTSILESNLRAGDVICRFGGDEFLIVVPGTGLLDSTRLGERLRLLVEKRQFECDTHKISVTISVGVATWPMMLVTEPEEMIGYADQALYGAKELGRNCVTAWLNDQPVPMAILEKNSALLLGER